MRPRPASTDPGPGPHLACLKPTHAPSAQRPSSHLRWGHSSCLPGQVSGPQQLQKHVCPNLTAVRGSGVCAWPWPQGPAKPPTPPDTPLPGLRAGVPPPSQTLQFLLGLHPDLGLTSSDINPHCQGRAVALGPLGPTSLLGSALQLELREDQGCGPPRRAVARAPSTLLGSVGLCK